MFKKASLRAFKEYQRANNNTINHLNMQNAIWSIPGINHVQDFYRLQDILLYSGSHEFGLLERLRDYIEGQL